MTVGEIGHCTSRSPLSHVQPAAPVNDGWIGPPPGHTSERTTHSSGANDRPALTLFASPAPAVKVIVPPDRVTVAAAGGGGEDEEGGEGDEQSHQQAFGFFVPGARQSVLDLGPFPSRIV